MQLNKLFWFKSLTFLIVFNFGSAFASDSLNIDIRKKIVVGGNIAAYSGLMSGLYFLWYSEYPMGKFHWLNDNKEWLQMDKAGHTFTCYYEGVAGMEMMKWAGYSKKQSAFIGGSYGLFIQTGVELLDGFSDGWGASWGDLTANTAGTTLAITQELLWNEQRINLKFSYSPSPYAAYRPNTLGANFPQRLLKDYNAQTYWLSGSIKAFVPQSKIPDWINIAVGYGADGMFGGYGNTFTKDGIAYDFSSTPRIRQFYISPDINLTKIKTKNKLIKTGLILLNGLKIPLPTLEYNSTKGFQAHLIHF